MALRWLLRAASVQIVAHSSDGEGGSHDGAKEQLVKIVGCREEESGRRSCRRAGELHKESSRVLEKKSECSGFQMPLHYPRYKKEDYQKMEEWKVDVLLREYGLPCQGSLEEKRAYAMGAFLWPDQL